MNLRLVGILIISAVSLTKNGAFSQCDLDFEHDVLVSEGKGQIFLKKNGGDDPIILKLFDALDGKDEFVQTIEFKSFGNRKRSVFEDLKPSTYFIQAENKECKITIGDLGGIIVRNDTK
jgi:hypothetical protein